MNVQENNNYSQPVQNPVRKKRAKKTDEEKLQELIQKKNEMDEKIKELQQKKRDEEKKIDQKKIMEAGKLVKNHLDNWESLSLEEVSSLTKRLLTK